MGKRLDHALSITMEGAEFCLNFARWQALAPAFWEEANRRLRANGLPAAKFQKNPGKPVPVHPLLGGGRRLAG